MTSFVGPDREGEGTNGGEGEEGTVTQALGEQSRVMLQDTDEDSACRAGHDDKLGPRSSDTTQVGTHDRDEVSEEESATKDKPGLHLDDDDEDNSACGLAGQPTLDDFSDLERVSEITTSGGYVVKDYDVDGDKDTMPSEDSDKCQSKLMTDDKDETAEKRFHIEKTLFSDSYIQHWTVRGSSFDKIFTKICDKKNEKLDLSIDEEDRPQNRNISASLTAVDSMVSKLAESRVHDVQKKHKESSNKMKQNAGGLSFTPSAQSDSFVLNDSRKVSTDINTLASSCFVSRDSAVYDRNKPVFLKTKEMVYGQKEVSAYDRNDEVCRFFAAIHHGDVDTLARLSRSDKTLVNSQHSGQTPIILAASHRSLETAELLLDFGADVSAVMPPNRTALGAAIQAKDENMGSMLIDRGANLQYVDQKNLSYLHWAAYYDLPTVLWTLVAYGADINAKNQDHDTALLVAVQREAHRAMDVLLSLPGIHIRTKNKNGLSALHLGTQKGYAREVEKMLAIDSSGVHDLTEHYATPLHVAAITDQAECARILILHGGANVNHPGGLGQPSTPLHTACHHGNFKTAEALLELGADVHAQDKHGNTPLHQTIGGPIKRGEKSEAGQQECQMRVAIACMLITSGAYVDTRNKEGRHPFNYGVTVVREGVKRFITQNKDIVKYRYKDD